jgi:hypothetical protein
LEVGAGEYESGYVVLAQVLLQTGLVKRVPTRLEDRDLVRAERLSVAGEEPVVVELSVRAGKQLGRQLHARPCAQQDLRAGLNEAAAGGLDVAAVGFAYADDVHDRGLGSSEWIGEPAHARERRGGSGNWERAAVENVALGVDRDQRGGVELRFGVTSPTLGSLAKGAV